MNYSELIPKLEEKFPELKGKFTIKTFPFGAKCRLYINFNEPHIINYIELRLYKDSILLAKPKSFLKPNNEYVTKYNEMQKCKKTFYKVKGIVNYINRELISRSKAKSLEKSPKYKNWTTLTEYGF